MPGTTDYGYQTPAQGEAPDDGSRRNQVLFGDHFATIAGTIIASSRTFAVKWPQNRPLAAGPNVVDLDLGRNSPCEDQCLAVAVNLCPEHLSARDEFLDLVIDADAAERLWALSVEATGLDPLA